MDIVIGAPDIPAIEGIAIADIPLACMERQHLAKLKNSAQYALFLYFAGDFILNLIEKYSNQEEPAKFAWRQGVTRRQYQNYLRGIAATYTEGVFRQNQVTRKSVAPLPTFDDYLSKFYSRWFRRNIANFALILPELYVVVDLPQSDSTPRSLAEERAENLNPYPSVVYPQFVHSLSLDQAGELEWVAIKQQKKLDGIELLKIYTEREIICTNTKGLISAVVPHNFGAVPVVRIAWEENTAYGDDTIFGNAFLSDVAEKCGGNLQITSSLMELVWQHMNMNLIVSEETMKRLEQIGIGNSKMIEESIPPGNAGGVTRYLEKPMEVFDALVKIIYELNPEEIFRSARLVDRSTAKQQSGIAKLLDMAPEVGVISEVAQFLMDADKQICSLLASVWPGAKAGAIEVDVKYPTDFSLKSANEIAKESAEMAQSIKAAGLPTSITGDREIAKRIYSSALQGGDPEMYQKIDSEIDTAPDVQPPKPGDAVIPDPTAKIAVMPPATTPAMPPMPPPATPATPAKNPKEIPA